MDRAVPGAECSGDVRGYTSMYAGYAPLEQSEWRFAVGPFAGDRMPVIRRHEPGRPAADRTLGEGPRTKKGEARRTDLRPGLTGPMQINYFLRGPHSLREEVRMDEEYAGQRSLLTDLRILARTIPAVLLGRRR